MGDILRTILPYTYVVGQEKLKLALELAYIAPRIGGVLISGERGTAKSTTVRAFASMMYQHLPVTIPINATEDRVIGGWQIQMLVKGKTEKLPGLIEEAHNKLLYIDEVNLLDDHIVNIILDVTSTGKLVIQRDVRITLVGTMNPEEGGLRPQLLDRFGLMVDVATLPESELRRAILRTVLQFDLALQQEETGQTSSFIEDGQKQTQQLYHELQQARSRYLTIEQTPEVTDACVRLIELTDAANEELLAYFTEDVVHTRRELALARCALALAQLSEDKQLQELHVERAAKLMGLQKRNAIDDSGTPDPELPEAAHEALEENQPSPSPEVTGTALQQPTQKQSIEVQAPEPDEQNIIDYVISAPDPYPEDTRPVLHEANSLQLPQRQFVGTRSDRGPIIGIEPTTSLRDLALVSTLMRALLFQSFRPKNQSTSLVLDWTDLRKYRRAAEPEQLLLLLLDYTSMPLKLRQRSLIPYLREAYIQRAGITIIKVGATSDSKKSSDCRCYRWARQCPPQGQS